MKKEKILIVDDDADIREMISVYFEKEGYEVVSATNGEQGLAVAKQETFSVILLDVMMPVMNGYQMLEKLRTFSDVPVILLTAKGEQMSKIQGFTKGCDDYVVKPFDFAELSLRIHAIRKRMEGTKQEEQKGILQVKDLVINLVEHTVKQRDKEIVLTPKEYDLLVILASNKGRVFSSRQLYELIWKEAVLENDSNVITHMRNLREKLGDKVKEGKYIKTIWGVGYKIEKDE